MNRFVAGAAAGAAGTTALNIVTYLDMAVRGRPASGTPERSIERVAGVLGVEVPGEPGDDGTRANRLSGLGALGGLLTGVAVGAGYGGMDGVLTRIGVPDGVGGRGGPLVAGAVAMLLANGQLVAMGVTDPRRWSATDWLSDVVPHLAYGWVTARVYAAAHDR
jgi:hypothetical protein